MKILPCRLLVLTALLSVAVLSGCGSSSKNSVPLNEEIYYQYSAFLNHSTVWTSGYNRYGQLGDGTLNNRSGFAQVSNANGMNKVDGLSAGANHVLAYSGNIVWSWGSNFQGRLGTGALIPTAGGSAYAPYPQTVNMGGPVSGVAAGARHSLAIVGTGRGVNAWGAGSLGQLGNGNVADSASAVAVVTGTGVPLANVGKVVAGAFHSLALTTDGTLYGWGANEYGQLAQDVAPGAGLVFHAAAVPVVSLADQVSSYLVAKGALAPAQVVAGVFPAGVAIGDIAAAGSYSLALVAASDAASPVAGTVWGWGYNGYGQLGPRLAPGLAAQIPQPVTDGSGNPLRNVIKISAGLLHVLALTEDPVTHQRAVWAWGLDDRAQLGIGDVEKPRATHLSLSLVPLRATVLDAIPGATGVIEDVYAFGNQSFARIGGKWYGWGDNGWGQLGQPVSTGSLSYLTRPIAIGF